MKAGGKVESKCKCGFVNETDIEVGSVSLLKLRSVVNAAACVSQFCDSLGIA